MNRPTQDLHMAASFLNALDSTGVFTFQAFADSKDNGDRSLSFVGHGTLAQHQERLLSLNERGAGVFVMINRGDGIVKAGAYTCRTNANVVEVRALFVDLDGAPLPTDIPENFRPNIIVESSPNRWHVYWKVLVCAREDFSRHQQALARRFGGDHKVKDLARVMRLPGFLHNKSSNPFLTRLVTP